jgi:hypothetical protein
VLHPLRADSAEVSRPAVEVAEAAVRVAEDAALAVDAAEDAAVALMTRRSGSLSPSSAAW